MQIRAMCYCGAQSRGNRNEDEILHPDDQNQTVDRHSPTTDDHASVYNTSQLGSSNDRSRRADSYQQREHAELEHNYFLTHNSRISFSPLPRYFHDAKY